MYSLVFKTKRVLDAYKTLIVKIRINILEAFVYQQLTNVKPNSSVVSL